MPALLLAALLMATSAAGTNEPPIAALLAKLMLAERLEVDYNLIELEAVEIAEWPDSCLGVAIPGRTCLRESTPGYLLVLRSGDTLYSYRADLSGLTIVPLAPQDALAPLTLATLAAGDPIESPLLLVGEAPGSWYFEAEFPVLLLDETGEQLASGIARADGEWMTVEQVPFSAELAFTIREPQSGTLVLLRANPSGLPEHDDQRRLPVRLLPGDP